MSPVQGLDPRQVVGTESPELGVGRRRMSAHDGRAMRCSRAGSRPFRMAGT
jgi:hypothetical protein